MTKPNVVREGDAIVFTWAGIEISLDRFAEERNTLTAEIVVASRIEDYRLLHSARFNLSSTQARSTLAKSLSERMDADWGGMLEQVCFIATAMYRDGEPTVDLSTVTPQAARWLLYPYVEYGGPTVLFAEGASGKSVLALAIGATVAGGQTFIGKPASAPVSVLYLDYETSADVHAMRLNALRASNGLSLVQPIFYRPMRSSLAEAAAAVRREIDKLKVGLVIVDSLGPAANGDLRDGTTALQIFTAVRSFKVPTLCIHHKRKNPDGAKSKADMYGSVYFANWARVVWEIDTVSHEGEDTIVAGLINSKMNNGRLAQKHAWNIHFINKPEECAGIEIKRTAFNAVAEFRPRISMPEQILEQLSRGPMALEDIATALEAKPATIKSRLYEMKGKGKVHKVDETLWGARASERISAGEYN